MDKEMDQLRALRVLCTRLENVVDELDAAFQDGNVTLDRVKDLDSYLFVVRPLDSAMATTDDLRSSYAGLHVAWHEWLRVADVT